MNFKIIFLLVSILTVATVLRFYKLTEIPPSLEWDEVATGYDANSILNTGKDQFGNYLPLSIRSIDDYKPPLYTYMTAVSIKFLGWNDFAVRFPAALLGVLAILTTFGMTYELFGKQKLALLSSLLLAISPWHVNFSRLALETNSTIFFTTCGVWFFLQGLKKGGFLILSALLIGLDLYLYHNARVFIPLFAMFIVILYFKNIWRQKTYLVISFLIISIFVLRLIPIVTSIEGQMRFQGTSMFTNAVPIDIYSAKINYAMWRQLDNAAGIGIYGKLFHNNYVLYGLRVLKNYLSHFDPNFWLFTSDYPRHHMPEMGIIYFIELPLIITGLFFLIKEFNKKGIFLLVIWILLAPISSAVTRDVPHALRSEIFLPTFQISVAAALLGLVHLLIQHRYIQKFVIIFAAVIYFLHVSFFLHKFLFIYARETSQDWQYGRKEAVEFTESVLNNYERIIVSTALDQPHIFWLYYMKYDPVKYLREGGTYSGGWAEVRNRVGKYEFHPFDFNKRASNGKVLYVGLPKEFSPTTPALKKIYYLNGVEAIWIVEG